MTRLLFVGRHTGGNHLIVAGIECAGDATNRTTLAGGVPTFEDDNRGDALRLSLALQLIQPALLTLERFVDVLRVEPLVHVEAIEHVEIALETRQRRPESSGGTRALRLGGAMPRLDAVEPAADRVA